MLFVSRRMYITFDVYDFFVGKNPYLGAKTVLKVEGPNYVRIRRCTVK